jgi:hypothetical protein
VSGDPCGPTAGKVRRDRSTSRRDAVPGHSGEHSFGPWSGVRRGRTTEVAGEGGHGGAIHRTRKSLGERLRRKLQRKVARRVPERRDFLFAERGTGGNREMARGVQHAATALGAGLQTAGASGVRAANGGPPVAYGSLRAARIQALCR